MTRKEPPRNIGASVRTRLTERARAKKENVQLVLTRYAIERLLYRLSISSCRTHFVLKGAMLFSLWAPAPYRSTGDLDLLGAGDPAPDRIKDIFQKIASVPAPDDGVEFKVETLQIEAARVEDEYTGVKVRLTASIAGAMLPLNIDIGFGDVVTPGAKEVEYPSMLDLPKPHLRAYPPETVVAEKFEAIVALGMGNSRMKDFFDIWAISETFSFESDLLARAIRATFARRQTPLPADVPIALTGVFADDLAKQAQWQGFLRRTAFAMSPPRLSAIAERIRIFVLPPIGRDEVAKLIWSPPGPWTAQR